MSNIFKQHNDFVRTAIPFPEATIIWMHYPIMINEDSPFSRKDFQTFFELRGIQTRPPFSGNILNQPMMKNQKYIANDSYNNANDLMKNGILAKPTKKNVIRFAPPLVINKTQIKEAITIIKSTLVKFEDK